MPIKREESNFVRFLKDERFIEWKLFPTDELNDYWDDFLQQHPAERKNIVLAEEHFRKIGISAYSLSGERKQEARDRLEKSLNRHTRKKRIPLFATVAAACTTVLIISLIYFQKEKDQTQNMHNQSVDYIVGNELESEDILFISGEQSTSFTENIDILIQNERTAKIKTEGSNDKEISIAQNGMNKLIVPYGKRSKIVLTDGTQVWLNSGSTLEFPSNFSKERRTVHLTGEMYIEVAPDKNSSFYVHTSDFNVKVYGTKFNITSYNGSFSSVVLVEGSLGLQSPDRAELLLLPSERAFLSEEGTLSKQKVDVVPFISWKEGYLTFNNTPITEALKQIERYYNLSFNYDDNVSFKGLTCTGKIILSDNLDNVMTVLSLISSTHFKRENNFIYIYKNESV